ncbi:MAG: hypothetical protein CTY35_02070 [Methylotenera sp.]|uniref:hypothetical protein n=1 Tax=Methylotenera sp. TaxID=2051956 RepID=UPI000D4787D6|nr:hypothetical protein [Methylotenera sp.]PPC84411.1 MAG: hypothetical protein CTY38_02290 [Methylotenera sp.]PPD01052.1 MAG: hypothetical protein CTY35_02070 [Methylotenera sp.]
MAHSAAEILRGLNQAKAPAQCRYQDIFKLCENCMDDVFAVQFNAFINGKSVSQVKRLLSEPNSRGLLPIHKLIKRDMNKAVALLLEWGKAFDLDYKVGRLTIMDALCQTNAIRDKMLRLVLSYTDDPDNNNGNSGFHPMVIFGGHEPSLIALLDAGATVEACMKRHPMLGGVFKERIYSARRNWMAGRLHKDNLPNTVLRARARQL